MDQCSGFFIVFDLDGFVKDSGLVSLSGCVGVTKLFQGAVDVELAGV